MACRPITNSWNLDKNSLRKELRKRLKDFCKADNRARESAYIGLKLGEALRQSKPDLLLAFVPKPTEVQIWPLLEEFLQLPQKFGQKLAFAKVCGKELKFIFYSESSSLPCQIIGQKLALNSKEFWHYNRDFNIIEPAATLSTYASFEALSRS